MPTTWYDAHVVKIQAATPNTRRFWVEIPTVEAFTFKPGQFVTMDLPIGEKRLQRWRSYSIANAPSAGFASYVWMEARAANTFSRT
jgi:ferredoxin-NADP reductase